jgi:ribosomal protein S18 acetylase RimI-like enzyme
MLLSALAIAPGLAVCIYIFYRDVHDREPALNLVISFIWGMLSTIPAALLESTTKDITDKSLAGIALTSFILIALVEEGSKFLALRYYGFNRRSFDEPLDGIVYGIMVSMGFATLENIVYVIEFGVSTALMRIFTAVPAHATFGVIMGYYVGKAKFDPQHRKKLLFRGLLGATLAHGFYDSFLFLNENKWIHRYISETTSGLLFFAGAIASLAVSLIFSLRLVRLHRLTSSRLYKTTPVLTVRHASKHDIELIRTLALQVWPATYAKILSPQQIHYMMNLIYSHDALRQQMESHHQFIIVYNSGIPIGFAAYSEIEPAVYKLHKIYLLQRQQGRGSGKFVLDQVIGDIKPKGAIALRLNVNRYNPAKGFYEKLGFEVIRTEDIDIGNGYMMNDYVMERKVNGD